MQKPHSAKPSVNASRSIVSGVNFAGAPFRFCDAQYAWNPGMEPAWLIPGDLNIKSLLLSFSIGFGVFLAVGTGDGLLLVPAPPQGRQLSPISSFRRYYWLVMS